MLVAGIIGAIVMVIVAIGFVMWLRQLRVKAEPLPGRSRTNLTPDQRVFYAVRPMMIVGIVVALINAWAFILFVPSANGKVFALMVVVSIVIVGAVAYVAQRVINKNAGSDPTVKDATS